MKNQKYSQGHELTMCLQKIAQLPNASNEFTAVCTAEIEVNARKFSSIGTSTAQGNNGVSDTGSLLDAAAAEATRKALAIAHGGIVNASEQGAAMPPPMAFAPQQVPQYETSKSYNHNPNKHASEKQLEVIKGMAERQRLNANAVALETTGKNLNQLSSYDANLLIQHMKKGG